MDYDRKPYHKLNKGKYLPYLGFTIENTIVTYKQA